MKNYFTITISDVHGSRHYSFKHVFKRFAWFIFAVLLFIWLVGGASLWWLMTTSEIIETENQRKIAAFNQTLKELSDDYSSIKAEKRIIQQELDKKNAQVEYLDQSLQGLEELVGIDIDEPTQLPYDERVKTVQLNSLGKSLMLTMVPSGHAVSNYRGITSRFGYRTHPLTKKRHFHGGIDYRAKTGVEVVATADGVVSFSGYSKETGFGNLVTLIHANGFKTRYGHLSQRSVKTGQLVKKGQKIGEVGSSGRSSGPHLHYEVLFLHHKLNPLPFDKWGMAEYDTIFEKVKGVPWASLSQSVNQIVEKAEKQLSRTVVSSTVK